MKTGLIISALVHGIFLLLIIIDPMWKSPSRSDEIIINEVTLISTAEFDASLSDSPIIADASIGAMTQPVIEVDDALRPEDAQAPEVTEIDVTETPSERDIDPDLSAVERLTQPEVAVDTAQPVSPSILPQVSPAISSGQFGNAPSPLFLEAPQPRAAPRIDSFSAPALPDDARVSDRTTEATSPDESASETVEESTAEAQPESVTEIVPEAQPDAPPSAAPPRASRPPRRSANVARAAAAIDQAVREAEEAAIRELLDAAVAESTAQAVEEPTTVALTGGQRQGIIEAVSRNWNKSIVIGKENFEQLVIVLEVSVAPNGMIVPGSVKPLEPSNPQGDHEVAYEAARRSVLRAEVIPLPAGQYPEGVRLELTFDPALDIAGFN
ncbi:hypothetical protein A9Q96_06725 [Rhodobacterales bacterium 52_120_T64]|nr:hypothetical protein A9Q96_06725 [Rhodobacterales bacterium 52_120_T64]